MIRIEIDHGVDVSEDIVSSVKGVGDALHTIIGTADPITIRFRWPDTNPTDLIEYRVRATVDLPERRINLFVPVAESKLAQTLAHEFAHIAQSEEVGLEIVGERVLYGGTLYDLAPYDERPWEMDANRRAEDFVAVLLAAGIGSNGGSNETT